MDSPIQISLQETNGTKISLSNMNAQSIESFSIVLNAFKQIVNAIDDSEEGIFSIKEGSVALAYNSSIAKKQLVYNEIDRAINGESEKKEIVDNLRIIQKEIKKENQVYSFNYTQKNGKIIDIKERIKDKNIIALKRQKKSIDNKIVIVSGVLNQIGGTKPNYHFKDEGLNKNITVQCEKEEAIQINTFLYQKISALVLEKTGTKGEKKYKHIDIINTNSIEAFSVFIKNYNAESEIITKLTLLYRFIDDDNTSNKLAKIKTLVKMFSDKDFTISEVKTIMVISKPFSEEIKADREKLNKIYRQKRAECLK